LVVLELEAIKPHCIPTLLGGLLPSRVGTFSKKKELNFASS
jgi:hypothetical protein